MGGILGGQQGSEGYGMKYPVESASLRSPRGMLVQREHSIAFHDELEIERDLIRHISKDDDELSRLIVRILRSALRKIDRLKTVGIYEERRRRIASDLEASSPAIPPPRLSVDREFENDFQNLLDGTKSADLRQRQRFHDLMDEMELWEKTPAETPKSLLRSLERAKLRGRGRPKASPPWQLEAEALDAMRVLCGREGASIPEAARLTAGREGRANRDSRADYFEKLYRQRMRLREIKTG
jgi:hypothetical protein